jgi:glycosyltransferase involved in cell wall biosynthesis
METFRIVIITETLPPERLRLQPWRYLGRLARTLQQEGHETFALTAQPGMDSWNEVPVVRHSNPRDFRTVRGLRRLIDAHGYDVGIVRMTASLFFSMRRGPTAPSRGKLIGIFLRPLHSGPDLVRRFLDPSLIPEIRLDLHHAALLASRTLGTWPQSVPLVNDFVFLWESDRQSGISAGLPASESHVVRHPFDPFFRDRSPTNVGSRLSPTITPVPRRIVFSGPPEPTRGVNDVLRLARVLPSDEPTQVLLLLRDGAFPEPVVTRTQTGAHEVLVVRGLVTKDELRAIYRLSHVAVFPYRWVRTGLPLVLLEAVAAGLPVVTTRVHPIRELEGQTGLVFARPRDPRDIARGVRWALDRDRRGELERKNEAWIRDTPDWPTIAKTFVSFIRE